MVNLKDFDQSETKKDSYDKLRFDVRGNFYRKSFTVLCRESKIYFLCNYYKTVYNQNAHKLFSSLHPLLILGPSGVGKTFTIQLFGKDLEEDVEHYNYRFQFTFKYINCQNHSIRSILTDLITSFLPEFPQVGLSTQSIFECLEDMLSQTMSFVLFVLDAIDHVSTDPDFNYLMQKLTSKNSQKHFTAIIISKDKSFLKYICEDDTLLEITKNVLVFEKYSKEQFTTLLKGRCGKEYGPSSISDDVLVKIVNLTYEHGDVKIALDKIKEILHNDSN